MSPRLIRLGALVGALLLFFSACGGGDESIEAFCDAGQELQDVDPGTEESQEILANLLDNAPEDIEDDLQTFSDVNDKIAEGGGDITQEDITALEAANEKISEFEDENC
ncbi:MAG: hypothetical protein ACLGHL_00610 [Actinomycetota bacterium]